MVAVLQAAVAMCLATSVPYLANTNKCVDIRAANESNGTAVQLYACNGTNAQSWTYSGGTLNAFHGAKCLDVTGGVNTDGTLVQIWDCAAGNTNQQWQIAGDTLLWSGTDKCLDLPGGNTADSTPLQIWTCGSGNVHQAWSLGGVGGTTTHTGFVSRVGNQLFLNGAVFRFFGANLYWLGLDENVQPSPGYPAQERVLEALAEAKAMGATVVRAHSLGISVGNPLSVEPSLGNFNAGAFAAIDFAMTAARHYGLKLVIPLVDDYDYYTGGKYTFLRWRGLSNGSDFYTNAQVIGDFKAYIAHLLTHINAYTGVAYKDDPTVMAWETGNELGAYMLEEGAPPTAWTQTIAEYIKSLAPHHLVIDGSDGINPAALSIAAVDINSDHLYPLNNSLFASDVSHVLGAGKALLIGEYDWTGQYGGASLSSFLSAMEQSGASGDIFWSLFGHNAACNGWVTHNDGYTLHYPGDNSDMQARAEAMREHGYRMQGVALPAASTPACPQPSLPQ